MIRLELSREDVRTGERLTGQAVWNSEGGKQPRKIEAICRWRIEGKGRSREEVVGQAVELDVASRSQVSLSLDFGIPSLGPLTYDGKLFRIIWEVVGRADLPFARDEVETKPFRVLPGPWRPELSRDEDFTPDPLSPPRGERGTE